MLTLRIKRFKGERWQKAIGDQLICKFYANLSLYLYIVPVTTLFIFFTDSCGFFSLTFVLAISLTLALRAVFFISHTHTHSPSFSLYLFCIILFYSRYRLWHHLVLSMPHSVFSHAANLVCVLHVSLCYSHSLSLSFSLHFPFASHCETEFT